MLKRRHIVLVLVLLCSVLFIALAVVPRLTDNFLNCDDGIKYLIGVSQSSLIDYPWLIAMNEEIKAETEKNEDIKIIFYDAAGDNNKQKQDIENMVKQGVDLIIVTPNDSEYLSETIGKVYSQGTPVIVMGHGINMDKCTMSIFCDDKKIGMYAGEYAAKLLGNKGGTILEIQGDPSLQISEERKKGFREAISKYPEIKVVYTVVGYWQRDKTEERVGEIFRKEPKVDLVFAHSDEMAIGTWRVATRENLKIEFISIGGLPIKINGLDFIRNGLIDATFKYPTGGREAISYALRILNGEKVPRAVELKTSLITKDNVNEYEN